MDEYQNNPTEEPVEGDEVIEQAEDLAPIEGDEIVEQAEDLEPIEDQEPIEDDVDTEPADDSAPEEVAAAEREVDPELLALAEWFVVHSYSGYENKVQRNLEQRIESMGMKDKIFRVVVPTEEEVEIREGQRRSSRKRVFPGYILVQMILDEESWYVVRNTPGVTGFVGTGTRPSPLSTEEVDKILSRMEAEQPRIKVSFRVGETVRITEGPFADFMAVVDELYPERGKVRVLVSFFGRETPVEMDFMQVERT
jgi:transcriptional antiterminator NusG